MFKDALLDLFETVVVVGQDLAGAGDVDDGFAGGGPGKFEDQFKPRAADVVVGRLRGEPVETRHFAIRFFADVVGERGGFQAFAQEFEFGFAFLAAQFLLDGAQLLAQEILALLFAHLALGLAGDFAADFENLHFVREVRMDHAEGVDPGFGGEQGVFEIHVHAEHAGNQVGHL